MDVRSVPFPKGTDRDSQYVCIFSFNIYLVVKKCTGNAVDTCTVFHDGVECECASVRTIG